MLIISDDILELLELNDLEMVQFALDQFMFEVAWRVFVVPANLYSVRAHSRFENEHRGHSLTIIPLHSFELRIEVEQVFFLLPYQLLGDLPILIVLEFSLWVSVGVVSEQLACLVLIDGELARQEADRVGAIRLARVVVIVVLAQVGRVVFVRSVDSVILKTLR